MFTEWLLEQDDRTDMTGRCARLCFDDYNAGCAGVYQTAGEWKKHFEAKHGAKLEPIMELLMHAFAEYSESLTPRTVEK